jgi:hypothetical protein
MKKLLGIVAVVALFAAPALADLPADRATATPMGVTPGVVNGDGLRDGTLIYDNIPFFWGGAGGYAGYGTLETWIGYRFTGLPWGDDLHGLPASSTVTFMEYGFLLTGISVPPGGSTVVTKAHRVRMFDMVSPSATHTLGYFPYGAKLADFTATYQFTITNPTTATANKTHAWYHLTAGVPDVHLPSTALWLSLDTMGAASPGYWLVGGAPGIGSTQDGNSAYIAPSPPTYPNPTGYFVPGPAVLTTGGVTTGIVARNLTVALGIPEPGTIALLAISGLAILRRRRA